VPEQYWAVCWNRLGIQASPLTYTYHLRQGVMLPVIKRSHGAQEMTSADWLFRKPCDQPPGMSAAFTWITSITAPDKYTVVGTQFFLCQLGMAVRRHGLSQIWAKEAVDAGPTIGKTRSVPDLTF